MQCTRLHSHRHSHPLKKCRLVTNKRAPRLEDEQLIHRPSKEVSEIINKQHSSFGAGNQYRCNRGVDSCPLTKRSPSGSFSPNARPSPHHAAVLRWRKGIVPQPLPGRRRSNTKAKGQGKAAPKVHRRFASFAISALDVSPQLDSFFVFFPL